MFLHKDFIICVLYVVREFGVYGEHHTALVWHYGDCFIFGHYLNDELFNKAFCERDLEKITF